MLDLLYGQVARWRRQAAERRPERRRLGRPVISVGNLSVGGTGKTPVVGALAQWLCEHGERPAILSRGYRRTDPAPGVVVVSDGRGPLAPLSRAGDEPLMLARAVPGAVVCVADDRYLAGLLAERSLGATIHLLDDGFQHYQLARDLDVLVTTPGEIPQGHVLPRGRLREPRDVASRADVLVVMGADAASAQEEARVVGVAVGCGASRVMGAPQITGIGTIPGLSPDRVLDSARPVRPDPSTPVVVACGIANPERFIDDVRRAGWRVVETMIFGDHHAFTPRDVLRMADRLAATGAAAVFTTDKDAVRFEALGPLPFVLYRVPISVAFDPADALFTCVRRASGGAGTPVPRPGAPRHPGASS